MKKTLKSIFSLFLVSLLFFSVYASDFPYIITDLEMVNMVQKSVASMQIIERQNDLVIAKISESDKEMLSYVSHQHDRCAGHFAFKTLEEAKKFLKNSSINNSTKKVMSDYTLNQKDLVEKLIKLPQELNIRQMIEKLSEYNNRYYKSETGVLAQEWIKALWEQMTQHRQDISVELFKHSDWPQPSLMATIKGLTDEMIVIGGHADSIVGWVSDKIKARAPGADDNASGIATMTEVLRVIAQSDYKPEKTIVFISYAAEEVGLLGSKAVAQKFKDDNKKVVGVLQLDMTNYHGSSHDITLISDNTNEAQNDFLTKLIDTYLPELTWKMGKCGYACSDHASWTALGYPSSFPFEAAGKEINPKIHTKNDLIDVSGGVADHALKFAKLSLAYLIELDRT